MASLQRILFIGAHPDDADILCGATACRLVSAGHTVKFVSATNGDTGHQTLSRIETAFRRKQEMEAAAKISGVEVEVLDHPCGLEPSVENRRTFVRLIRKFAPTVVITHRLCDYHPDHRATAQLVIDCAYVCMVPHFCEDTPIPEKPPVFAHSFDRFQEPRPHRADAAVGFDSLLEKKLELFHCHASQFYEWLPWCDGEPGVDAARLSVEQRNEHLKKWVARFIEAANGARDILIKAYGKDEGGKIVYAETFEQSPYGRQVSQEEFQKLFMP